MTIAGRWQRLEGLALLMAATVAYGYTGYSYWLFAGLFLVPDLSMLAYLAGPRWGALGYNLVHALTGPLLLGVTALFLGHGLLMALSLVWLAHIGFDRVLGYGLKSPNSFHNTHLGLIGKARAQ